MRRFIFILMIVLLPLRGWMGEAMATEMAAINLIALKAINTPANTDLSVENSMSDCGMHKSKTTDNSTNSATKASCTHCQACHATGLVSTVQIISIDKVNYAQPLAQASPFASASIALSQKPPIL
jgi:hypothetical protein